MKFRMLMLAYDGTKNAITSLQNEMDLRLHVGAWPDHFLFDPQTLVLSPTNMNPELQKYRAVEPSLLPLLSLRKPLFGAGRLGQSTGPA